MKLGIMQPYFMPYIGYFQLINMVDKFVLYDNIEFSKKGWFHRNRILMNGKDLMFSIPLKKDSDYLHVNQREISTEFLKQKVKILRQIENSYKKAPFFSEAYPVISEIFNFQEYNLFEFLLNSIKTLNEYLGIDTEIIISSTIDIDHELKSEQKVLELCKSTRADNYINSIGGLSLYDKRMFEEEKIKLDFFKTNDIQYQQYTHEFVASLSIIDVMMFNSKEEIKVLLNQFHLV